MPAHLDKRVQRTKADFKETLLRLLIHKPFHRISISELVREARYNRGTFYAHYNAKEDLLQELCKDTLQELIVQIRQPYQSSTRVNMKELPTENITLFAYIKAHAELYRLLLSDHVQTDFRHQMVRYIERLFVEEYEYELDEGMTVNPKWLYIYRAHGVAGLVIRWIEDDFPDSPQYMNEQIVALMLSSPEVFRVK